MAKQVLQIKKIESVQQAKVLAGAAKNPNNPNAKIGDLIDGAFNARINGVMCFGLGFDSKEDVIESLQSGNFTLIQARAGNKNFGSAGGFTFKKKVTPATEDDLKMFRAQLIEDSKEAAATNNLSVDSVMGGAEDDDLFLSARERRLKAQRIALLGEVRVAEEPLIMAH